ncbi:hypothetical protein EVAR_96119_1 [Eumeta japonica]|uniref:Uncharacterized protein n=1 Tax=Eumeta variegata TaxID=151549 RepID=A0A4C1VF18_EUMVA|nr:hypothetical protein EVAR_96119_1 [Eumeta japonica]
MPNHMFVKVLGRTVIKKPNKFESNLPTEEESVQICRTNLEIAENSIKAQLYAASNPALLYTPALHSLQYSLQSAIEHCIRVGISKAKLCASIDI